VPQDSGRSGSTLPVRAAIRVYGWLTHLLPSDLRREYGSDIEADFCLLARDAHDRAGTPGVARALVGAAVDLAGRGVSEWWVERFVRRPGTVRGLRPERGRTGDEMMKLVQEFRLAARALAQRAGFTLAVVATLALGIGATVAIFTIVNSILIRPLPYPESDRIVWIRHHAPGIDLPMVENSPGTLALYADHARSFVALAAVAPGQRNLAGGREPARLDVLEVTPSLFNVLRVRPRVGRAFTDADALPGAAPVTILMHATWVMHFGSAPDIVGRTVRLNDVTTEVVGVMPEGFTFLLPATAALVPLWPNPAGGFGAFGMAAFARLAPGVDLAAAQQEVVALQQRIPELHPDVTSSFLSDIGWRASVRPMRDILVEDVRTGLWIVLGTVGFLLLVACASVANLFLVRAEARQREIGIRMALGAARGRIAATFLYESILIGVAGGVWGLVAALFTVRALVALGPAELPRLEEIAIDGTVLLFAAAVSVGAGVLFGVLPLIRRSDAPLSALVGVSRSHTTGRERQHVRRVLIVTQIALALVLLTGSGLMLRSFQRLRAVDPGFDADGVLTVGLSLGDNRSREEAARLTHLILDELRALPGVVSAGATSALPLGSEGNNNAGSFTIAARPRAGDALPPVGYVAIVTDGLHETLRTSLLEGRALTRSDATGGPPVAVVNRTFARQFLDDRALGERIRFDDQVDTTWHEIVGVVADVRSTGLREAVRPIAYVSMTTPTTSARTTVMNIAARATGDPMALAPRVREIAQRVGPDIPLTSARTLRSISDEALASTSFTVTVLSAAALIALLLGAIGLYGVIGYVVSQRTREIGVRIALGAAPARVRRMVLRQGLTLAGLGLAIGLGAAALLSRLLDSLLFQVDSRDPATFISVSAILLAVTAVAAWVPARRASGVSPLEALRAE
jgi:predicted permease